ncbi:fatty acid synthase-like [Sitophilus oryzae]|uniref:Fatty acid synthase-like n=1 Tax=Sitophilus oryzae TaxID=7048 RepID=A0A6J2YIC5_SITOR|nr:fatty acid synthase-like [Sitophilus oryzae]
MSEEIVISGIAGRYPECDSFNEFKEALFSGKDLITEDNRRFEPGTYNTPKRTGKINGVENFDASFFGIPPRLANFIEPRHRIVFETVFEAMVDAGYNPKEFRGTNMGVFVGCSNFGAEEIYSDADNTFGYSAFGCVISQLANRISFCFDLKGPSFTIDTACSSSFYALANAVNAIESGRIDAAIVADFEKQFMSLPYERLLNNDIRT